MAILKKVSELVAGDVFTYELKIKKREAFVVLHHNPDKDSISVQSRNTDKEKSIKITDKEVYWLRKDPIY